MREERTSGNSTTVTTIPVVQDKQILPSEVWWTSEDVAAAVVELQRAASQWRFLAVPDVGLVLAILPCMVSLDDLRLWLRSSASLLTNARSWGLYVADAQRWLERRTEALVQLERAILHENRSTDKWRKS